MHVILVVVLVLLAVSLVVLVLLQRGKGADIGAAFGSGASQTVFGAQGSASFLTRATAVIATLFFLTCLGLAYLSGHDKRPQSIMETVGAGVPTKAASEQPAAAEKAAGQEQPSDVPDVPETDSTAPK
jgi:preprotein translocase subunit SecG